jgi:hypothetical protein
MSRIHIRTSTLDVNAKFGGHVFRGATFVSSNLYLNE